MAALCKNKKIIRQRSIWRAGDKLGICIVTYFGDRLGLNYNSQNIPPLAELIARGRQS